MAPKTRLQLLTGASTSSVFAPPDNESCADCALILFESVAIEKWSKRYFYCAEVNNRRHYMYIFCVTGKLGSKKLRGHLAKESPLSWNMSSVFSPFYHNTCFLPRIIFFFAQCLIPTNYTRGAAATLRSYATTTYLIFTSILHDQCTYCPLVSFRNVQWLFQQFTKLIDYLVFMLCVDWWVPAIYFILFSSFPPIYFCPSVVRYRTATRYLLFFQSDGSVQCSVAFIQLYLFPPKPHRAPSPIASR